MQRASEDLELREPLCGSRCMEKNFVAVEDALADFHPGTLLEALVWSRLPYDGRVATTVRKLVDLHWGNTPFEGDWKLGNRNAFAYLSEFLELFLRSE